MRPLAGPAVMLTMVVGFIAYRAVSKEDGPRPEFTGLELSLPGEEGSCYSLSTTFIANGVFGKTPRTWKKVGDHGWQLRVERVIQGYNGPALEFTNWTFEKHGTGAELVRVEASKGLPQEPAASLADLLTAPNAMHSTPVDRCRQPGATGFLYKRK
jgi:hypothetical protein